MSDLLPIVPGCKAILINCLNNENNGKEVVVGSFAGKKNWLRPDGERVFINTWEIDTILLTFDGSYAVRPLVPEAVLMRIDGGDFTGETQEQEKELVQ